MMEEKTKEQILEELEALQTRLTGFSDLKSQFELLSKMAQDSEQRLRDILDNALTWLWEVDINGKYTYACPTVEKILGYKAEEIIGNKYFYDFFHPDDYDELKKAAFEVINGKEAFREFMNRNLNKNGETVWLSTSGIPKFDENGRLLGYRGVDTDITELKNTQQTLEETNKRCRLIANATFNAIWDWDLASDEVIWNNGVNTLFNYAENEVGHHVNWWKEHIHPEDRQRVVSGINGVIESGRKEWLDEYRFHCGNGSYAYVVDRGFVINDNKGKPVRMIGAMMDISRRKLALKQLEASEEKYRTLVENINVGVYRNTVEGHFLHANKAALKIFGYKDLSEFMNISALELYQDPLERELFLEDLLRYSLVKNKELRLKSKDGKPIWVSCTAKIQYDENGGIRWIDGAIEDITERKKAERSLRENEERFRAIFEEAADSIVLIEVPSGAVVEFNDRACQSLGYTRDEFKRLKISDFEVIEASVEISRHIERIVKKRADIFETKQRRKDGEIRDILISCRVISINDRPFIQAIWKDITERKKAEKKLRKLNRELRLSNRKLKQLSLRDPHTGLYNHRFLVEVIDSEFYRAKRYKQPLSVVMLDIDYFKSINDVYGHRFGDLVLKQFARLIKKVVRRYDIVIRYGGEEFIIISSGIDRFAALSLAGRLLDALNLYNFGNKEHLVKLKLSLAVASYPEDKVVKGMDLIELIDQILNKVKEEGGNRVYSSMDIKRKKSPALGRTANFTKVKLLREKIYRLTRRSNQSLIEAVFAFARTIKLRDRYTGEHVERIVHYSTEIARTLGLSRDEVELIRQASILHDLGKIGISDKILLKNSRLTKKEFEEIKKHPKIGVDIIRPIHFLHDIIPLILCHHERWDGKGYPQGLRQDEIPIGARIVAIADVYQSLISDRPYRKAFTEHRAREMIKAGSGTQFDPKITSVFLEILKGKVC
jgi:diguanylate cyclase (GGDEF)-like protein/PAS domain S-box-containing protein